MVFSLPIESERVFINDAKIDDLPRDLTPLFQQKMCAAGTNHSMPVVTSGLNNTAFAPPPFHFAQITPRRIVENCATNPVQAVSLHLLSSLEPITTVTIVTSQSFTAPIITNSSFATQTSPNLSCCTNPSPLVRQQPTVTSQAITDLVFTSSNIGETSVPVAPVESKGTVFYCNPSPQTAPYSTGNIITSRQQNPLSITAPPFLPTLGQAATVAATSLAVQDLVQLLAESRNTNFQSENYPNTTAILFNGKRTSACLKVPWSLQLFRKMLNWRTW